MGEATSNQLTHTILLSVTCMSFEILFTKVKRTNIFYKDLFSYFAKSCLLKRGASIAHSVRYSLPGREISHCPSSSIFVA